MSAITFAFDQNEINNLINKASAEENILVSIFSGKYESVQKKYLFLAAQSSDRSSAPPVGCPVPPGWNDTLTINVTHEQLEGLPKYVIPADAKKRLLANTATNKELWVSLEGVINGNVGSTKLTFKIKDTNNDTIDRIDAEVF